MIFFPPADILYPELANPAVRAADKITDNAYNNECDFTPLPWLQCCFILQGEPVRRRSLEAKALPSSARAGNWRSVPREIALNAAGVNTARRCNG
jgi:hypothetical protein